MNIAEFECDIIKIAARYGVKEIKVDEDKYREIENVCHQRLAFNPFVTVEPDNKIEIYICGVRIYK